MKLSNSSGFSFINNHPVLTVVKSTPAYVKINPENKTKLVLEKETTTRKRIDNFIIGDMLIYVR